MTHGPFDGDVADGYVWGRGAVDMKNLLAMELTVVRMLAAEARAAGRDPASDADPRADPRRPLRSARPTRRPAASTASAGSWPSDPS